MGVGGSYVEDGEDTVWAKVRVCVTPTRSDSLYPSPSPLLPPLSLPHTPSRSPLHSDLPLAIQHHHRYCHSERHFATTGVTLARPSIGVTHF